MSRDDEVLGFCGDFRRWVGGALRKLSRSRQGRRRAVPASSTHAPGLMLAVVGVSVSPGVLRCWGEMLLCVCDV